MTEDEHRERHKQLHKALDELIADYAACTPPGTLTNSSLLDFMKWSHEQTIHPVGGDHE